MFNLGALSKPFGGFLGPTMGLLFSQIWRKFLGELRLALGAPSYELISLLCNRKKCPPRHKPTKKAPLHILFSPALSKNLGNINFIFGLHMVRPTPKLK